MTADQEAIISVLRVYASALKAADPDAVVALFTEDGVLLPQETPTAVGAEAVKRAYAGLIQVIHLDITFHVAEVVVLTPDWAFARSTSTGIMTIIATGATLPEANQELFIFKKDGETWKIARYAFSVINPPPTG